MLLILYIGGAPKFPQTRAFAPHINQYSPRILQAKKKKTNPTNCASRQMGSTRKKSIGGTFANRNNKITETGTHTQSLRPPTITKQQTSKATTELRPHQTLISKLVCGVKTVILWTGY
jgi:hypothetical protein